MAQTSFKMKRNSFFSFATTAVLAATLLGSCKKDEWPPKNHQPGAYSADVIDKWATMQLRLMRNATGIPNQAFSRHFAYTGIAALQSLAPGFHGQNDWSGEWNGLTGLPPRNLSDRYYYPSNVNAAMAAINRSMFPNASAADKAGIDSLEAAFNADFLATTEQSLIATSANYGKAVAEAVYNWAETDGYKNANAPYTPPTGPGLWVPTPPAFAAAATPYWGNNRPIIAGSTSNTLPAAPPVYSTEPASAFFKMVKQVHDASQALTDDQKAMAIFWRDVPGVSSPGHWLSIMQQVMRKKNASLDKAALAYALTGSAINDALIACWKAKYKYNLVRPITYIRDVMGYSTWSSHIGTPSHPEYPSAHSALSGAAAEALDRLFGNVGTITDNTYNYLGLVPRTYASVSAIANEAGQSRLYGGIHYQPSIDAGLMQGKKVTGNLFSNGKMID
jgi:hypothetical protein